MASVTVAATEPGAAFFRLPKISCRPRLCALLLMACDAAAVTVSGVLALLLTSHHRNFSRSLAAWPVLGVFLGVFASYRLYPGVIHNAVEELRRLAMGLTTGFLLLASAIYFTHTGPSYSRRAFLLWWFASLVATPLLRSLLRTSVCRRSWWGVPLAVFYTGEGTLDLLREMQGHPEVGLKPVVLLGAPFAACSRYSLPTAGAQFAPAVKRGGVTRALVALPAAGSASVLSDLEDYTSFFPRLMILHSAPGLFSLAMEACPIAGSPGVEVRRDLLLPVPRTAKRAIDLLITCLGLPVVGITLAFLGVLVRLESPGPVFFGHRRVGRSNVAFAAWKLRTMYVNADQLLQQALIQDDALREEWRRHRKLRRDPRITRLGRFLRKTSLDELPQLWNVLRGEMSLVGPRPIVEEEIDDYGPEFSLYCRVTPGITGLWQVSGRNMVTVRDRVRLDSYYVRNWSFWLDLHILARTTKAVLTGQGAY
jgi:Undecaprenyl-phosphate galactose phosphotransferase WbaP